MAPPKAARGSNLRPEETDDVQLVPVGPTVLALESQV
jgi:hypothetical protein